MLTKKEWDALPPEEQQLRQDEKPEETGDKTPPNVEELAKQVEGLTTKLSSLEDEKRGIYGDLKSERELRQRLEATNAELVRRLNEQSDDPLAGKADDDYVSVADVKRIIANANKTANASQRRTEEQDEADTIRVNYETDEERMSERKDLKIPYQEAMAEFKSLASKNRALWVTVNEEAKRKNGKPAELAYRIALTSDKFISKIEANAREALVGSLEKEGKLKPRKLPAGGPASASLDPSLMTEQDLLSLSDETLDELLKKT